uniref:Uncharacterized protein n=1 Tax=Mycena chlorophos TaxID=658473 RepID=A0ABQ0LJW9_MYCCL|nr:predicted protein [Mycena chlorophos]
MITPDVVPKGEQSNSSTRRSKLVPQSTALTSTWSSTSAYATSHEEERFTRRTSLSATTMPETSQDSTSSGPEQ